MKLTEGLKCLLVNKLSTVLQETVTLAEFNKLFVYLDRHNTNKRIVPYGIFENPENLEILEKSQAGQVFRAWLDIMTCNIPKDFNKSRKLVRQFKDFLHSYQDSLAYNLSVAGIFTATLTLFFIDEDEIEAIMPVEDMDRLLQCIEAIRGYLASIFFLDIITEETSIEALLGIFINTPSEDLIQRVIELGISLIE